MKKLNAPFLEFSSTLKIHVEHVEIRLKKAQQQSPIATHRRNGRYCAAQHLRRNKLMNGPPGQWAQGDPRPIRPVPPSGFLPPRQLKPAPYKRDTRSRTTSIALAHGDDYDD